MIEFEAFDYVSVCSTGELARLLGGLSRRCRRAFFIWASIVHRWSFASRFEEVRRKKVRALTCGVIGTTATRKRRGCLAIVVLVAGCINDTSPLHIRRKKLLSVFDEVAFRNDRYIDTSDPVLFVSPLFFSIRVFSFPSFFLFFFFFFSFDHAVQFLFTITLQPCVNATNFVCIFSR